MWYEKFLSIIDASWIGRAVDRRLELIDRTDPDNIYIENIRSFFGMPFKVARFFCDVAVREGVFDRRIGYLCPQDKNIIHYRRRGDTLPSEVTCLVCEAEGADNFEFDPETLQVIDVYSLAAKR